MSVKCQTLTFKGIALKTENKQKAGAGTLGWIALAAAPLFFSTNIILGKVAKSIDPFTLASLRWSTSALILLIIIRPQWPIAARLLRQQWKLLLLAGFLAMWICGAIVYLALHSTTANNATLIYTTPPLMIIVIEYFWRGRPISLREIIGIIAAVIGIGVIITRGDLTALLEMRFNSGDLLIMLAATSWAVYSVVLKSRVFEGVPTLVIFALTASMGSLTLLPFASYELMTSANIPHSLYQWQMVGGIILLSSLIPFSLYQFGIKQHGSSTGGVFLYMMAPFGLLLAWIVLGETLSAQILTGCALVLGGVIMATFPVKLLFR